MAQRIHDEGGDPTPTVVRKLLGGGSPNLIVEELRLWRQEAQSGAPAAAARSAQTANVQALKVAQDLGMQALAASLSQLRELVEQQALSTQRSVSAERDVGAVVAMLRGLTAEASGLAQSIVAERQARNEELDKLSQRFEAVQRVMLLSVEEARAETRRWKEEHQKVKDELLTWRTTMQDQNNALSLQCASFKGQLEESRRECAALRAALSDATTARRAQAA